MYKKLSLVALNIFFIVLASPLFSQEFSAGINTEAPNPNAVLHLVAPNGNQGILIPSLTTAQRTSMTLTADDNGLMVFDSDLNAFFFWVNPNWIASKNTDSQTLANVLGEGSSAGGVNITDVADPVNPQDVATKSYVDSRPATDNQDLELTGNTLSLTNDPTSIDLSPFLDNTDNQNLSSVLASGNDAGAITITNLPTPVNAGDAATKDYVDGQTGTQNLALIGADLSIDNGNTVDLSALPIDGDVTGAINAMVVNAIGGETATDVALATATVNGNPSIDLDATDDLALTATPNAAGDVSGDYASGLLVDFVGGEAALDVGTATGLVLSAPALDLDATDDLALTATPNAAGDVSGDYASGLLVDFVGGEAALDIATATGLVLSAPALDLDATDDLDLTTVPNAAGDISGDFSGGLVIDPNAVTTTELADGTIANADLDKANIPLSGFGAASTTVDVGGQLISNVAAPVAATDAATRGYVDALPVLPVTTDGQIIVSNATTPTAVAMTGDVTINNSGATTISNNAIGSAEISDGTVANADINDVDWIKITAIPTGFADNVDDIDDADNDPTNEIELPVSAALGDVLEYDGTDWIAGFDDIDDADNDPTNEIELPVSAALGDVLEYDGTDWIAGFDDIDDADNDPTNEIELPVSAALGDVLEYDGTDWIAGFDDIDDADNDPTNEIELPVSAALGDVLEYDGTDWVAGVDDEGLLIVSTVDIIDDNVTLAKIQNGTANQVLVTDGVGNPTYIDQNTLATGPATDLVAGGSVVSDAEVDNNITIDGGNIDNTVIGGTTAAAGTFTSLDAIGAVDLGANSIESAEITDGTITDIDVNDISAGKVTAGTFADARISQTSVVQHESVLSITTAQISGLGTAALLNAGVSDGDLVQVQSGGFLPTLNGSNLTNLPAPGLNDGNIFVGNAGNNAVGVPMTGPVTINNSGATTINNNAIGSAEIADGTIATADIADDNVTLAKLQNGTANQVLATDGVGNPVYIAQNALAVGPAADLVAGGSVVSDAEVDNNITIDGGNIDNTVIGGTTAAAGSFTDISTTGTANLNGAVNNLGDANTDVINVIGTMSLNEDLTFNRPTNNAQLFVSDQTVGPANMVIPDFAGGAPGEFVFTNYDQTLINKSLTDASVLYVDDGDASKRAQFDASLITTATTRTYTFPDKDGTLAMLSDVGGSLVSEPNATSIVGGTNAAPALTGTANTIYGVSAGTALITGQANTLVGNNTGTAIVGGSFNTMLGQGSGASATLGNNNVLIGQAAGDAITTGQQNTFIGSRSGEGSNPSGSGNVTGNQITLIGFQSDVASDGLVNATAIGYRAVVAADNSIVLGGTAGSAVNVGVGTESPAVVLDIVGSDAIRLPVGNNLERPTGLTLADAGLLRYSNEGGSEGFEGYDGTSWGSLGGNITGTANRIPKFNASGDGLADSDLFANGVNNQLTVQHTATAIPDFVIHDAGLGDASMQFNRGGAAFFAMGIDYDGSDNFKISSGTDVTSNEFVIDRVSGNVGLGIGSPSRELHLHNGAGGISFQMTNSASAGTATTNGFVIDYNNSDQTVDFRHYEGADIAFGDGAAQTMIIDNTNDRVGIGAATPGATLDVNGDALISGGAAITGVTRTDRLSSTVTVLATPPAVIGQSPPSKVVRFTSTFGITAGWYDVVQEGEEMILINDTGGVFNIQESGNFITGGPDYPLQSQRAVKIIFAGGLWRILGN